MSATLVELDPKVLLAHPNNPRLDLGDLKSMAASIAEVGVIEPLIVVSDGNGGHVIKAGHRRAAAAVESNAITVPCIVVDSDVAGLELMQMLAENTVRRDLSVGEQAKAFQTLLDLGVEATAIGRATGATAKNVTSTAALAGSTTAIKTAHRYDLTLDQAAAIAEFDDDQETVKALVVGAQRSEQEFERVAEAARGHRLDVAARVKVAAELEAAGVTITEARPGWEFKKDAPTRIEYLAGPKPGKAMTKAQHAKCPGHAAYINVEAYDHRAKAVLLCTAPGEHGHRKPGRSSVDSVEASSEDREATSQARREVIANNKAWTVAEPVRRKFVTALGQRKTAPKGMLRFVTQELLDHPRLLIDARESLVAEMFGKLTPPKDCADARLPVTLFAFIAAAHESTMDKATWRLQRNPHGEYLVFLADQGYDLADVERIVTGDAPHPVESAPEVDEEPSNVIPMKEARSA